MFADELDALEKRYAVKTNNEGYGIRLGYGMNVVCGDDTVAAGRFVSSAPRMSETLPDTKGVASVSELLRPKRRKRANT